MFSDNCWSGNSRGPSSKRTDLLGLKAKELFYFEKNMTLWSVHYDCVDWRKAHNLKVVSYLCPWLSVGATTLVKFSLWPAVHQSQTFNNKK